MNEKTKRTAENESRFTIENLLEDEYINLENADVALAYYYDRYFGTETAPELWELNYHAMSYELAIIKRTLDSAITCILSLTGHGGEDCMRRAEAIAKIIASNLE